jgi:hypothetical protein
MRPRRRPLAPPVPDPLREGGLARAQRARQAALGRLQHGQGLPRRLHQLPALAQNKDAGQIRRYRTQHSRSKVESDGRL